MEPWLIDVREYAEFAAGHIEGSRLVPLGSVWDECGQWNRAQPITLICRSGPRAEDARQQLVARGFTAVSVLKGGVEAWRSAGKPLAALERRPWSMQRQVQLTAGSLVVVTLALGFFFSPWILLATAFVGAGLVFAAVSDTCMMASLLAHLPWNRSCGG